MPKKKSLELRWRLETSVRFESKRHQVSTTPSRALSHTAVSTQGSRATITRGFRQQAGSEGLTSGQRNERKAWPGRSIGEGESSAEIEIWSAVSGHQLSGGLRRDPFTSLPATTGYACDGDALDFLVTTVWNQSRAFNPALDSFLRFALAEATQNPALFLAQIAYAQGYFERVILRKSSTSLVFAKHRSNALKQFQTQLSKAVLCTGDAEILTIYTFIALAGMLGAQSNELEAHYAGLWRLIHMRGGLDQLGGDGLLKGEIIRLDLFRPLTPSSTFMCKPLHYAKHPFSADYSACVSKLPPGLSELALSHYLSIELVNLLVAYQDWWRMSEMGQANDVWLQDIMHSSRQHLDSLIVHGTTEASSQIEKSISLIIIMVSAKIYYGMKLHNLGVHLSKYLLGLCDSRFWNVSNTCNTSGVREQTLVQKCMAWVVVAAAEVGDIDSNAITSHQFMEMVFEMREIDKLKGSLGDETGWDSFEDEVLNWFACSGGLGMLLAERKRCWMKYWALRIPKLPPDHDLLDIRAL